MERFPFSRDEWRAVQDATLLVVNSGQAGDDLLRASHLAGLLDVLNDLKTRHGDHPILLETEADFIEDDAARVVLYRRAATIAVSHGLPTLDIRLSLVQLLLDSGEPAAARCELQACADEVPGADELERTWWSDLEREILEKTQSD